MGRGKKQTLFYNIRYRFDDEYRDALGSGTLVPSDPERPWVAPLEVTAWDGEDQYRSDRWVEVGTDDRDVADAVFRQLLPLYGSVILEDRTGEEIATRRMEGVPLEWLADHVLTSAVCCEPTRLTLSPKIEEDRAANLEAMRKARLPKAPRAPRNKPNTGQVTPRLRARVLERDNFTCRRCGAGRGAALEVDHIVPRCKGGANDETNLQTLCWSCNRGKGASDPHPSELSA